MTRIHPSAILEPGVELDADVDVGPFCLVGAGVRIGAGSRLLSHVVVRGRTRLGKNNIVSPFAVIGGDAQVRKGGPADASGDAPRWAVDIGDANVVRESVTINAASSPSGTVIGSHNLFMAGCHVAHDVTVGSRCVVANGVQLAGHVVVGDWVTFGGLSAVAQHLHVGESAFVAGGAMCERDVPPFVIVQGDRARVRALNVVGLERRGVPADSILALKKAFTRVWVGRDGRLPEVVAALDRKDPWVSRLAAWLTDSKLQVPPHRRQGRR